MSNLVIVAIPDENDRVWKISSEKVPHCTLLFLGDLDKVQHIEQIVQFVEHAANTTLDRFYLPVDRRGELGADKADVLFFKKSRYDYRAVRDFRNVLLQDHNIKTAYDGATQFEGPWQPHLTLGYPATPAKPDPTDRDQSFYDVCFNRIAVWTGDFDGPEFLIKDYWDKIDELDLNLPVSDAMAYSGLEPEEQTANLGAEFLSHHGIKGMKWGVRQHRESMLRKEAAQHRKKADAFANSKFSSVHQKTAVVKELRKKADAKEAAANTLKSKLDAKTTPPEAKAPSAKSVVSQGSRSKTKIKVEGGENHPAHQDAIKVAEAQTKLKKSGAAALSNSELREVANRLQLEQQVSQLTKSGGQKFVQNILKSQGNQQANKFVQKKFQERTA